MISNDLYCATVSESSVLANEDNGHASPAESMDPDIIIRCPASDPELVKQWLTDAKGTVLSRLDRYIKRPLQDFTRKCYWTAERLIDFIMSLERDGIQNQLNTLFPMNEIPVRNSSFSEARKKVNHELFEDLFYTFNEQVTTNATFKGFTLLSTDGSTVNVPTNRSQNTTYHPNKATDGGYNQIYLDGRFNIMSGFYTDVRFSVGKKSDERDSFLQMVARCRVPGNLCNILDRGYEGYNPFAHLIEKGEYFVCRAKEASSNGILSGINVPETDEYDFMHTFFLTRSQAASYRKNPYYKFMPANQRFDYLTDNEDVYVMTLRFVRFRTASGAYETIITNLLEPVHKITRDDLKYMYYLRWGGSEVSYRQLKYSADLLYFHSYLLENILQECYASLLMFNICRLISAHVPVKEDDLETQPPVLTKEQYEEVCNKFEERLKTAEDNPSVLHHPVKVTFVIYRFNFNVVFDDIRRFIFGEGTAENLIARMRKTLISVRPGRVFTRNVKAQRARTVLY